MPSALLSVCFSSAIDTTVSWRLSPEIVIILALLTRCTLKEPVLAMSCGNEGSFEHESVRISGTESPDVYIFGVGKVNFRRVTRQSRYICLVQIKDCDSYLGRQLEFFECWAGSTRILKIDRYESVFFDPVAKKRVVDQAQAQVDLTRWG